MPQARARRPRIDRRGAADANVPVLAALVDEGWDIVAPVPSCVLMFKQELPLLFPDDPDVQKVREAMFDPFEYLMLRHGRAAAHGFQPAARQGRLPRRLPPARAEHRPEDPRHAGAVPGTAGRADRALLGPRRHLRREERVSRDLDEDRPSGDQRLQPPAPITTRAIARWPGTRSNPGSMVASVPPTHPLRLLRMRLRNLKRQYSAPAALRMRSCAPSRPARPRAATRGSATSSDRG